MSSGDALADRMAHLGRLLVERRNEAQMHTTEDPDEWGSASFDYGYHLAMEDMREWIEFDEKDPDLLLHEVECYLDNTDNWPVDEDETEIDALHRRLAHWEENECDDPDRTMTAWRYLGVLSATSALQQQGVTLPDRWVSDVVEGVRELMGEGDDD